MSTGAMKKSDVRELAAWVKVGVLRDFWRGCRRLVRRSDKRCVVVKWTVGEHGRLCMGASLGDCPAGKVSKSMVHRWQPWRVVLACS